MSPAYPVATLACSIIWKTLDFSASGQVDSTLCGGTPFYGIPPSASRVPDLGSSHTRRHADVEPKNDGAGFDLFGSSWWEW